jgi:hypothetical protein
MSVQKHDMITRVVGSEWNTIAHLQSKSSTILLHSAGTLPAGQHVVGSAWRGFKQFED